MATVNTGMVNFIEVPSLSSYDSADVLFVEYRKHWKPVNMERVVFVTFDGVRRDEFFQGSPFGSNAAPLFPYVWQQLRQRAVFFGTSMTDDPMHASHPSYISLPCYQTMLTGLVQPSQDNDAGPVPCSTIFDRAVLELGLGADDIGVFASWTKIQHAIGECQTAIALTTGPSEGEANLPPWKECRWDHVTQELALAYLKQHDPRFLYVSLTDSDDVSHTGDFDGYLAALRRCDHFLAQLVETLEAMPGQSFLLVTTDHGRGLGDDWTDHHSELAHCREIWALALGIGVDIGKRNDQIAARSHLDIRPTLEMALGMRPLAGVGRGRSLVTGFGESCDG